MADPGAERLFHLITLAPVALGLSTARWMGLTLVMPVFTRMGANGLARGGIAFAMAVPLVPGTMDMLEGMEASRAFLDILILAGKELAIGAALGIIMGIPFWGAEMAGETLDVQRGTAVGTLADPLGGNQSSVFGTFFAIISVALFLASGGFETLVTAMYDTLLLWPIGAFLPPVAVPVETIFIGLLQKMTVVAVTLAAPLIIATMSGDALLGFVAKLAPQIHLDQLGAAVKSLILTAMLVIYAVVFPHDLIRATAALRGVVPELTAAQP
jgi:type III secretion protein T